MRSVSTRVASDTHEELKERADERDTSISHEARESIKRGLGAESIEAERNELRGMLAARDDHREDVTEIVEYVERKERAGAMKRLKWALFGRGN